jgi:hypothetical protein
VEESADIRESKIVQLEHTGLGRFEDSSRRKKDSRPAGGNDVAPPSIFHETEVKNQRSPHNKMEIAGELNDVDGSKLEPPHQDMHDSNEVAGLKLEPPHQDKHDSNEIAGSKFEPPHQYIHDSQTHEDVSPASRPPSFTKPSMAPPLPKNLTKAESLVKDVGYTRPEWSGSPSKHDFPYVFEVLKKLFAFIFLRC